MFSGGWRQHLKPARRPTWPTTASTSTTRRCATAPSRRASTSPSPTSWPSRGTWTTLGVGFIEGGWPGANPKDTEFFRRAQTELDLKHAQLAAFGATRRAGAKAADDPQVAALRESGAPVVTLVAKSHDRHVELALRTTLEENLAMIRDTVSHLRAEGRRVFLDAEHFFDGYRSNPAYALEVVRTAAEAGADVIALCDTNGGMLPDELGRGRRTRPRATGARLGIHCHDDTGCAVANTLAAVDAGATHVQGTANGYGERVGNANLFTVVANLQLKRGFDLVPPEALAEMTRIAHAIAEVTNLTPASHAALRRASPPSRTRPACTPPPIKVDPNLYQHIDPAQVGNDMRMLVSDMAGRASVELKGRELGYDLAGDEASRELVDRVKELESQGYTFEAADASFELLLRDEPSRRAHAPLRGRVLAGDRRAPPGRRAGQRGHGQAVRQGRADRRHRRGQRPGQRARPGAAAGAGAALPRARRARAGRLQGPHPGGHARHRRRHPRADHSSDGTGEWSTVGVAENIIAASWQALEEAFTYGLLRAGHDRLTGVATTRLAEDRASSSTAARSTAGSSRRRRRQERSAPLTRKLTGPRTSPG